MAKSITSVVFDLGGVLIDWNPEYLYRELIPDDAERHAFLTTVCTRAWHDQHDVGVTFADNAQVLLRQYPNDPHRQNLIKAWGERFTEMFGGPIQATVAILEKLHRDGLPLYALTNWSAETIGWSRQSFPFLSLFKDIVVSGVEKVMKPDRAIYEILLKRTELDPHSAIYIDDRPENLTPAAALGFTTIHFTTPEALAAELGRYHLSPLKRCA
jgi:2-haloacid dehalogenase